MKILDILPITDAAQLPLKKGTLQFIQDAYKEGLKYVIQSLLGGSTQILPDTAYALWGCEKNSDFGGQHHTIKPGVIYYNNELFEVIETHLHITDPNETVLLTIDIDQYGADADPVTFTDGNARNVHNIRRILPVAGHSHASVPGYICDYSGGNGLKFKTINVIDLKTKVSSITSNVTTLTTNLANEVSRATLKDEGLQDQIDTLNGGWDTLTLSSANVTIASGSGSPGLSAIAGYIHYHIEGKKVVGNFFLGVTISGTVNKIDITLPETIVWPAYSSSALCFYEANYSMKAGRPTGTRVIRLEKFDASGMGSGSYNGEFTAQIES